MLNWGLLGLGNMGSKFISCFKNVDPEIRLEGFASKSNLKNKVSKFKDLHQFESYQDLISSKNIDAIYISTLNHTHKDLIMTAIKNNKKVLCEKPLAVNLEEIEELHKLLKNKKDFFYEAIAYRSHPQTIILKEILNDKEIGKIKRIESNFGFKTRIKPESRLFKKEFGGGAILDLGCYPISFFYLFIDSENKIKIDQTKVDYCNTNVDVDAEINITIDDKIQTIGKVSLQKNLPNICKIYCEKGIITITSPWLQNKSSYIEIETKSRYFKKFIKNNFDSFTNQINIISNAFMGKKINNNYLVDIEESRRIFKILDLWKRK